MDFRVQDVQSEQVHRESGVRPGGSTESLGAFIAREKELFRVAPVHEIEDRLNKLQVMMVDLATMARIRKQSYLAETCAVCHGPWKLHLPGGGPVPVGNLLWHEEDGTTHNVYACDQACLSRLQYEVEKRTFKLRLDRDNARIAEQNNKKPRR